VSARGRDLAALAVRRSDPSLVVAALVRLAREAGDAERRGDPRDGLVEMPLGFRSAAKLGVDADELVERALAELDGRPAEILRAFAARPDRDAIERMSYVESSSDGRFSYRWSPER
jgi:hypothetical protein